MPPESPSVIQDMSKYRTTTTDNEGGRATKGHLHKKTEKHENSVNASIQQNAEHSFQVAQRNSIQSPLLRLPGEIRTLIWKHAMGYSCIEISTTGFSKQLARLLHTARPMERTSSNSKSYVKPSFQLHKVCRQMFVEAAPFIYTLNTFSFSGLSAIDLWINSRSTVQLQLVSSIDFPLEYSHLYDHEFREALCKTFPNIQRIGIDILVPYLSRSINETLQDRKQYIMKRIHQREGEDVLVSWFCSPDFPATLLTTLKDNHFL